MEQWLPYVAQLQETQVVANPDLLCRIFTLDLSSSQISSIQNSLTTLSDEQITRIVKQSGILPSFPRFEAIVLNYLLFCKHIIASSPSECFDLYGKFFVSLQHVYGDARGSCLNGVLKQCIKEIWRLFHKRGNEYLEWFAAVMLRLFNAVRSEREPMTDSSVNSKKSMVLFYSCMISRAYFHSNQFTSAGNVFNNMHSVEISFSQFCTAEQVEYRFWLGRYLLYQEDVNHAFTHLDWAYTNALEPSFQKQLILDWLVVPSILVGRLPTNALIYERMQTSTDSAKSIIIQLVQWVKQGACPPNYSSIVRNNEWVKSRHLAPLILKHLPLIIYKRGLKKLHALIKVDRIPLNEARTAFSINKAEDAELVLTESICDKLVSTGQLKGNILPVSRAVLLKSSGCFPNLLEANSQQRALQSRDKWMVQ